MDSKAIQSVFLGKSFSKNDIHVGLSQILDYLPPGSLGHVSFRGPQLCFNLHQHAVHMCEENISHKDLQLTNTHPFFLEFFFVAVISEV